MIIYFSATGNSEYIAQKLVEINERLISIPEAIDNCTYEFEIKKNEKVGIITPTYFWRISKI